MRLFVRRSHRVRRGRRWYCRSRLLLKVYHHQAHTWRSRLPRPCSGVAPNHYGTSLPTFPILSCMWWTVSVISIFLKKTKLYERAMTSLSVSTHNKTTFPCHNLIRLYSDYGHSTISTSVLSLISSSNCCVFSGVAFCISLTSSE